MTIMVPNQSFQGPSGSFYQANEGPLVDDTHEDVVAAPDYFQEFTGFFTEYPDPSGHADGEVLTLTSETPGWEAPAVPEGGSRPRFGFGRIIVGSARDPDDATAGTVSLYSVDESGRTILRLTPKDITKYNYVGCWEPTEGRLVAFINYDNPTGRYDIATIDPDDPGSLTVLTGDLDIAAAPSGPTWAPDGSAIYYCAYDPLDTDHADIWAMDPDGSNKRQITTLGDDEDGKVGVNFPISFSPDGSQFVTMLDDANSEGHTAGPTNGFYVFDADGSNGTRIAGGEDFGGNADGTYYQTSCAWSVMDRIAVSVTVARDDDPIAGTHDYTDFYTLKPDGSDIVNVTNVTVADSYPDVWARACWNPDGSALLATWSSGLLRYVSLDGSYVELADGIDVSGLSYAGAS